MEPLVLVVIERPHHGQANDDHNAKGNTEPERGNGYQPEVVVPWLDAQRDPTRWVQAAREESSVRRLEFKRLDRVRRNDPVAKRVVYGVLVVEHKGVIGVERPTRRDIEWILSLLDELP